MAAKKQTESGWSPLTFRGEVTKIVAEDSKGNPLAYDSGNTYVEVHISDGDGTDYSFHKSIPADLADEVFPTGVTMIHRFAMNDRGFPRHVLSTPA